MEVVGRSTAEAARRPEARRFRSAVSAPAPARGTGTFWRHFPNEPDAPRTAEPILIPKLRIQLADFPYLR